MKGPLSAIQSKYYIWLSLLSYIHTSKSMSGNPLEFCSSLFSILTIYVTSGPWEPTSCMSSHIYTELPTTVFIHFWILFYVFFKEVTAELWRNKPRQTSVWYLRNTSLLQRQESEKLVWYSLIKSEAKSSSTTHLSPQLSSYQQTLLWPRPLAFKRKMSRRLNILCII